MDRKLTTKQVKELVAFHKRAVSKRGPVKPTTMRFLDQHEAAKRLPGIVLHHTVSVKRPPTE